jgi:uncharacterized protein YecE (DUF72 family)
MSPLDPQPELFVSGPAAPVDVAPDAARWNEVAGQLPPGVRLGTSSWSFPGWVGRVWDREATPKTLARHGLASYARHPLLGAVGVDRSYYETPPATVFVDYARQVPREFRFMVKAERSVVTPEGPHFLDPLYARNRILAPVCEGLGGKLEVLLLQFPPMDPAQVGGPRRFAEALYRFLRDVGDAAPLAVEIRTPELLTEDYRQALHHGGATHGYVVHSRMSPLPEQVAALSPEAAVGPLLIRWMLAPGAGYEAARDAWAPFAELARADPTNRGAIAGLARRASTLGRPVTIIVNNKAEGSAPASIEALARTLAGNADPPVTRS